MVYSQYIGPATIVLTVETALTPTAYATWQSSHGKRYSTLRKLNSIPNSRPSTPRSAPFRPRSPASIR
jgi:hypothetical protein